MKVGWTAAAAGARAPACRTVAGRCAGARGAGKRSSSGSGEGLDTRAGDRTRASRISACREEFLAAGREGLKSRPAPEEDRPLVEAQRKVGELAMELDIGLKPGDGPAPSPAEALSVSQRPDAPLPRVCRVAFGVQVGGV